MHWRPRGGRGSPGEPLPAVPAPAAWCTFPCVALLRARRHGLACLLRRLDSVLADRHTAGCNLAVGGDLRSSEDGRARYQQRPVTRNEIDDGCAVGHQDFLRSVLVLERELVAFGGPHDLGEIG